MSPSASEQIAPAVSENTTIVIIQNGVGVDIEFRKRFPKNPILSGVTWVSASQPSTGVVVVSVTSAIERPHKMLTRLSI